MPILISCLSSGKGTWTEITRIIQSRPWTKIFLITNTFGQENFSLKQENISFVIIDTNNDDINMLVQKIKRSFKDIKDFEVALSLISGVGKEHMAILEAVLESGLNFRLITLNKNNQVEVLSLQPIS